MPTAEKTKLVDTADGELGLTIDPSLLRGATADLLIKNRSEIFSSNVLSQKDLAQLHDPVTTEATAQKETKYCQ